MLLLLKNKGHLDTKGSHLEKKSFLVWFFSEGGDVMFKCKLLPYSKKIEELFCLSLDIFQEGGGGKVT